MTKFPADTPEPLAPWVLTGVVPNVEEKPAPVAPAEPFNPLAGLDEADEA
ncbi:hypothetical protein [Methylobacterium sp. SD21]